MLLSSNSWSVRGSLDSATAVVIVALRSLLDKRPTRFKKSSPDMPSTRRHTIDLEICSASPTKIGRASCRERVQSHGDDEAVRRNAGRGATHRLANAEGRCT